MHGVADFVHLHVHTEYSLLDGMIRLKDLLDRAEAFQMPAVAMTDHGNLFGAVNLYEKARERGIKPIIGCEVYVAPGDRKSRDAVGHHLVLLCKNYKGYQNLCKIVSSAFLEGFYYKPRTDMSMIAEHNEGLIALSACLKGEVCQALLVEDEEKAIEAAGRFKEIFDNGRYYLELQENGIEDQRRVNRGLIALGRRLDLPLVATNDCHYLLREHARAHEALLCIQTGKNLSDEKRMRMSTDEFYFKSPGEMKEAFAEVPEAISNTIEIAARCNLDWDLDSLHFPEFHIPDGMTPNELFEKKTREGFERRIEDIRLSDPHFEKRKAEYQKRLNYEIKIIQDMGFPGYFLIVADFVNWAKSSEIPVGPGRGSAAGSLASYCLRITDLNPLAYGLIFERFLNPERRSMPDIDVDFCQDRRGEVIEYVTEKYGGSEHVAQIITFGTMKARAVVRDVGRVLGVPYGDVDRLAKLIPMNSKLKDAVQGEPKISEAARKDPLIKELLELADALEGISRHASTHAAGLVISDLPMVNYLPLYKDPKEEGVVAQYDMKCVEKVGLVKFDLLGLKTLTQIKYCVELIKKNRGVDLDIDKIPMDDEKVFELLGAGDTGGVFQLESSGMKELLTQLRPNRFEEMIAVVALYRPGPLGSGDVRRFIERKHGREEVTYRAPELEPIAKETYGVLLYQEQVMEIAVKLAGYTMGEADKLRKAMGKKKPELMAAEEDKFMAGATANGIPKDKAKAIFDDMAQFAGYGFNKSHAAVYAWIAYQTAYLKARYPVEFMSALLTMDMGDTDKVVRYIKECADKGAPVLQPHVNHGEWKFVALGDSIRMGLGAVKNVGKAAVEAVVEARLEGGEYKNLWDFCDRADLKRVNRRTLESLIKAGAFDGLGPDRARMLAAIDSALDSGQRAMREREAGQTNLFDMLGDESGSDYVEQNYPNADPWSSTELLANEKEALGFYLTGHPLARFEDMMKKYGVVETTRAPLLAGGQEILIGGVVTAKKEHLTKKKERMAFLTVTDLKGSIETVVFAGVYQEARDLLAEEDRPILIRGRVEVSEDRAKILASEIIPLDKAPEKLSLTLHVTMHRPLATPEQVEFLGRILKSRRGKAKVMVHVVIQGRSETVVALPADYRATPDRELILALEELLGEGTVRLEAA